MEILMKIFPFSFKPKKDIAELIINILLHLGVGVAASILIFVFPPIGIVSGIIDLYLTAGIVLSILNYCKVL